MPLSGDLRKDLSRLRAKRSELDRAFLREVFRVADRHALTHCWPAWEAALHLQERSLEDATITPTSTVTMDFTVDPTAKPPGKAFASILRQIRGSGIDPSRVHWITGPDVAGAKVSSVIEIRMPDGRRLARDELETVRVQDLGRLLEKVAHAALIKKRRAGIRLKGTVSYRTPENQRALEEWIQQGSRGQPPPPELVEESYEDHAFPVQELRRAAVRMRGKHENVLAIQWNGPLSVPSAPYTIRVHLERVTANRLAMRAEEAKGRAGVAKIRARTLAQQNTVSKATGDRHLLDVPTVVGLTELFHELVGVRLVAPKDPADRKLWLEELVDRVEDLQPELDSLDRRFVFLNVRPGMRRDELASAWPRVEEYRRRRGHPAQGSNVYSRWLLNTFSAYVAKKMTLVQIETQFQEDYPEGGYCDNCRSNVWTATRTDPCPACGCRITRGSSPIHPGQRAIRERLRRAGLLPADGSGQRQK